MTPQDYACLDGIAIADLIRAGEVSPAEVMAAAREAIARFNPPINAVIETYDDEPGGLPLTASASPLAGAPFLFKDVGGVPEGRLSEAGSRLGRGMRAAYDSSLWRRYRAAGLLPLGRTASPEFAFNLTTENLLHGPTRNPWNPDHSAGGSSGGAAAAVAAGMAPVAEANDGGGSIRIPASCCGVFGLKPTRGRLSSAPGAAEYLSGLSQSHVVTRSVRDSAAALDIAAGAEPGDPYVIERPERPFLEEVGRPVGRPRIAFTTAPWNGASVAPVVRAAVEEAARLCEDLGAIVEEARPELGISWEAFVHANAVIWSSHIAAWIDSLSAATGRPIDADHLEHTSLACYRFGASRSARDLIGALYMCNAVSRSVGRFFENYDLLLTPTLPAPPPPLGLFNADDPELEARGWTAKIFEGSPFTPLFNVTGQPAMSVPWTRTAENLPIGVQFAAPMNGEAMLIRLAAAIEAAHPWDVRIPAYLSTS